MSLSNNSKLLIGIGILALLSLSFALSPSSPSISKSSHFRNDEDKADLKRSISKQSSNDPVTFDDPAEPVQKTLEKFSKHFPSDLAFFPCHSDKQAAQMQRDGMANHGETRAKCDDVGICECPDNMVFNGIVCEESDLNWGDPYETLRKKWIVVPTSIEKYNGQKIVWERSTVEAKYFRTRPTTQEMVDKFTEAEMVEHWKQTTYHDPLTQFYATTLADKKILDVGSGMARQTMMFALQGAHVTFCDIVKSNLDMLRVIAKGLGITSAKFIYLENLKSLSELDPTGYDVITAFGSMHHMPREMIKVEISHYLKHLRYGGRWIQLAYPVTRWKGNRNFHDFGIETDHVGTPWAEWYEPGKLLRTFQPFSFNMLWCGIAGDKHHFIWFDLVYLGIRDPDTGIISQPNKNMPSASGSMPVIKY